MLDLLGCEEQGDRPRTSGVHGVSCSLVCSARVCNCVVELNSVQLQKQFPDYEIFESIGEK